MSSLYEALRLPASSKCIRVLEVYPNSLATPHTDREIHGELSVINLEDDPAPKFTALSYVWGVFDPEPHHVRCGASRIKITPNNFAALTTLSRKFGNDKFVIWVDAICINQEDEEEKRRQIGMMGDVYSKAAVTYIWLGEGTPETDRAMRYLNTAGFLEYFKSEDGTIQPRPWRAALSAILARFSLTRHPYPLRMINRKWYRFPFHFRWVMIVPSSRFPPLFVLFRIPSVKYASSQDIIDLFSRTWISRIWTYQEAVLSSNPVVVCGDRQLTWFRLSQSFAFLDSVMWEPRDTFNSWQCVAMSRYLRHGLHGSSPSQDTEHPEMEAYVKFASKVHKRVSSLASPIYFTFTLLVGGIVQLSLYELLRSQAYNKRVRIMAVFQIFWYVPLCLFLIFTSPLYHILQRDASVGRAQEKVYRFDREIPEEDCFLIGSIHRQATSPIDTVLGMWSILESIGNPAQIPSTITNTDDVFRIFSHQMIELTGSLSPLLMAGMHGCPNQPSWVADWSAAKRSDWNSYVEYRLSGRCARWLKRDLDIRTPFTFDNERGILHIFTMKFQHPLPIVRFHKFIPVNMTYNEQEREVHLYNIECLIALTSHTLDYCFYDDFFRENPASVTRLQYQEWVHFLFVKGLGSSPHLKLSCLNRRHPLCQIRPKRFRRLWYTHTTICNWLAAQEKLMYSTKTPGSESVEIRGLCSRTAEIGDLILDVIGLTSSIVVRKLSEENDHHVRIIGLASDRREEPRVWDANEPMTEFFVH